jgi:hypothetical protein
MEEDNDGSRDTMDLLRSAARRWAQAVMQL